MYAGTFADYCTMPMRTIILLLSFLLLNGHAAHCQLVINEISQGIDGTKEYAELVVRGTRSCTDSCADLRGWIIDDNNGWLGSGTGQGIATGCMRFSSNSNWACVPYGSIILIYNDGDKNTSITIVDDPTDANKDLVYIVPASSALFEKNTATPISPSSPGYVYPTSGFTAGGSWSGLGLSNNGDAIILTAPGNLGAPYFSVGFGNLSNSGNATVFKPTAGGAKVYYLTNGQYNDAAGWNVGNATADETPGVPNTTANRQWIEDMRRSGANVNTILRACILQGQSYNFNGQMLTASGTYTKTYPVSAGCDSMVTLYLDVITPATEEQELGGCGSVVHNGVTYTASVVVSDTLRSMQGCDSIYRRMHIVVDNTVPVSQTTTVSGCGKVTYKGNDYYTPGSITDTLRTRFGCDSVYLTLSLDILDVPDLTASPDTAVCLGTGITLTVSGAPYVNWENVGANATVTVYPEKTTTYRVWGQNDNGCKDTTSVTVTVSDFHLSLLVNNTQVMQGDRITLHTAGTSPYTVLAWTPAALFPLQTERSQTFITDKTGEISVIAVSDIGCTDTATLLLEVAPDVPELYIPSAFSPNGDGLNDLFMIVGNFPVERFHIMVFNRWGQQVFESNDISISWDGIAGGKPAEVGVYYYMTEATIRIFDKTRSVSLKGDVTLLR